jgi:hypothetical protein
MMIWIGKKKNTSTPFYLYTKEFKRIIYLFHLVVFMVFNGQIPSMIYFIAPNIHNDENITINIIHHVINHWSNNLLQVLYLQLDNNNLENNNQIVFGYLSMHIELEIFQKVKVGFLLVGNTHDQIDQMFNDFVVTLKRLNNYYILLLTIVLSSNINYV